MSKHLEVKFGVGDRVWCIAHEYRPRKEPCARCGGRGKLVGLDGAEQHCCAPRCHQGNVTVEAFSQWEILGEDTVGRVCACAYSPGRGGEKGDRYEEYMLHGTGVGSGRIWHSDLVWPSREAAQAECDRRNTAEASA